MSIKIGYTAINKVTKQKVDFFAYTSDKMIGNNNKLDAYNWIVNHLDTSYQWDYYPNGKFQHSINNL
jgi:hypothetical protein